ncbi:MAG TPA: carboxypeptidase regulatory-like domain-containing protein [Planctomycetaceae bacterium]|nr:hypothetical protein [Rubinisphaera sp.]HCS54644.1 carboxypeptidase regulatory-like domain-containing protein [Planctomycetaceae bacterium]
MATLIILFAVCGCSSDRIPTYPCRGRVQFEGGELVKTGVIELESIEHGTTATGKISPDGTFVLGTYREDDGAVAGEHRVIVIQMVMNDGVIQHTQDHGEAVPSRYSSYEQSDLREKVEAKELNDLVIVIASE